MRWKFVLVFAAVCLLETAVTVAAPRGVDPDEWIAVTLPEFSLYSNAGSERALEIAGHLERFGTVFGMLAPDMALASPVPTTIFAFRDEESFAPYRKESGGRGVKILGQFLSHRDGNVMTLNAAPELLNGYGVVLHEYVHYLVSHNFPAVPRWFNEGLAEYYSTFAVEDEFAVVGRPVRRHLEWLRRHGEIDLAKVLSAVGPQDVHAAEGAGHFYAVAWGLVHYLLTTDADRLADYLADTAAGGSGDAVNRFAEVFGVRLEEMEARLRTYLLGKPPPAASLALDRLPPLAATGAKRARPTSLYVNLGQLLLRQGLEAAAEQHLHLALSYAPRAGDAYAALGHLRDLQQRFEEAEVLYGQALAAVPQAAISYLHYGRHLLTRVQMRRAARDRAGARVLASSAVEAFRGATELDSGFAEAYAMQGYAHLFGGLDPADGIAPLETARRLLPTRPDVVFYLVQLEARRREFGRARALARGPLRRLGGDEWTARADEEIARAELLHRAGQALGDGRTKEGLELMAEAIAITTDPDLQALMEDDLAGLQQQLEKRGSS